MDHTCPTITGGACPHIPIISTLQANMGEIMRTLNELKTSMEALTKMTTTIVVVEKEQGYQKEALERAFKQIDALSKASELHTNELNEIHAMKKLAVGLWTVLASGLGVVILKLFAPII